MGARQVQVLLWAVREGRGRRRVSNGAAPSDTEPVPVSTTAVGMSGASAYVVPAEAPDFFTEWQPIDSSAV